MEHGLLGRTGLSVSKNVPGRGAIEDEMNRIAPLYTGASSIFDHRDAESVSRLGNVRFDT